MENKNKSINDKKCDNKMKNNCLDNKNHDKKCCNHGEGGDPSEHGEKCCCGHKDHGEEKHSPGDHERHCHCDRHEHEGACGCDHDHGGGFTGRVALAYLAGAVLLLIAFLGEFDVIHMAFGVAASILTYIYFGREAWVGAVRDVRRGKLFTEFTLMCVATVGAAALLELADAAAVMYLYSLGEMVQGLAYRRSKKNIAELIDITEDTVGILAGKSVKRVPASKARVGDVIYVTLGERVALDGVVIEGEGFADTSAITGESAPRELLRGTECLSGSILISGAVSLRVTEPYENSTANKLKEAVARAAKQKAPTEKKITRFAAVFTPMAFGLAVLVLAVGWMVRGDFARALRTALVVLVCSCPCSLVLSVPLSYFAGIGRAAGRGIVFRGGEVIDNVAALQTVIFDKTGTLTSATLKYDGIWLPAEAPLTKTQLLDISRSALAKSPHATARSFCQVYDAKTPHRIEKVENLGGRGLLCTVDGHSAAFGNRALMAEMGLSVGAPPETAIFVAVEGKLCGALMFRSKLKPEALPELAKLRRYGVRRMAVMSGDAEGAVVSAAEALGLSEYYAELKPDQKLARLEHIYKEEKKRDKKATVAFCGDGLNDSAVIARADVGIAMGSGAAVTVESADVVIVDDSPARLGDMMSVAKSTVRIANQNIVISLGIKLAVVLFGALFTPSLELAVIADVGAALLTVLNAMRAGAA